MSQYIFLLGKASDLCFKELKAVLEQFSAPAERMAKNYATADLKEDISEKLIDILGGTVKIGKILSTDPSDEVEVIIKDLATSTHKPNFSIFGMPESISRQIKLSLRNQGVPSRFILTDDLYATAASQQKNYVEYWKIIVEETTYIVKVAAFQNISAWAKRDYERPNVDPKSGMLPPKIARILVNLSGPLSPESTVYDPFCGSGTILAEAMMLGHNVIGSDNSQKAVDDSHQNLNWLKRNYSLDTSFRVFKKEVAHVTKEDLEVDTDVIIFEPFMGPSKIEEKKVKNIAKGLEKLYIGALRNCARLQKPGNKLVAIFPQFRFGKFVKSTDSLIDRCENFGYTRSDGPLVYDRPNSTVVRRIYILVKN